jgi:hypothetical protein
MSTPAADQAQAVAANSAVWVTIIQDLARAASFASP